MMGSELIGIFLIFVLGYALGWEKVMSQVEKTDKTIFSKLKEQNREWWNDLLDSVKAKTKEQKVEELEKQITELQEE